MLDIKVGAALLGFTLVEQRTILDCVKEGKEAPTSRLQEAVAKVTEIIDAHEEVVEGYAGFPIDKSVIDKNKNTFKDDRNIGRVISQGGQSMVITGKKADGRYQVVGKKGEKTAKAPEDIGLNMQREHIDIDDLHQQMVEGMKQARKNVGASTCWDGYKAKGTKKKGGKEVPNCVKEDFEALVEEIILDEEFDTFSFEELHDICVEALMELDGEVLTEALEAIDELDLLTERMDPKEVQRRRDQAKDRLATGAAMKKAAASSSDKPAAAPSRREKMKAALKSAGKAVAKGAGRAVGTAVRAAKSAGSEFKKGYERGSSGSSSKPAPGGSSVSSSQSPSSSGGSSSSGEGRTRLRDKIKSGIKKVVGGAARAVSRGARNVARRMSEQPTYNWRAELGINDEA